MENIKKDFVADCKCNILLWSVINNTTGDEDLSNKHVSVVGKIGKFSMFALKSETVDDYMVNDCMVDDYEIRFAFIVEGMNILRSDSIRDSWYKCSADNLKNFIMIKTHAYTYRFEMIDDNTKGLTDSEKIKILGEESRSKIK